MTKRKYSITQKLSRKMGKHIRRWIREESTGETWKTLVGYNANDLKKHLQKQFEPGMTWQNYGEWHIDHIIPLAAFNFTCYSDLQFMQAWSLDNLRPLWASTKIAKKYGSDSIGNIEKGANVESEWQPCLCIDTKKRRHKQKKRFIHNCRECDKVFETEKWSQKKFCSKECQVKALSRRMREHYIRLAMTQSTKIQYKECRCCGKVFVVSPSRRTSKYCSKECGKSGRYGTGRKRLRGTGYKKKRKYNLPTGVYLSASKKSPFRARVKVDGVWVWSGNFKTQAEARSGYVEATKRLGLRI